MLTYESHEYWVPAIEPMVSPMLIGEETPPEPMPPVPPPMPPVDDPNSSKDYTAGSFYVAMDIRTEVQRTMAETWNADHPLPVPEPAP